MSGEYHDCADDDASYSIAAAIMLTANPKYCDAIEIWESRRLVGRIDRRDIKIGD